MANGLFVRNNIKIAEKFHKIAQESFDCKAESVDFSKAFTVVEKINKWVEQQTENKITHLLSSDAVNGDTSAILVNAIYFKAKWMNPFISRQTGKKDFYLSPSQKVEVDTMYTENRFGYVKLQDLNAEALEMRYENLSISMLVILPNDIDGLQKLEDSLKGKNLNDITSKMDQKTVRVLIPKFRIEYEIDLKEPLKKMGILSIFEESADLSGIFEGDISKKISDVKHKAVLECNEGGTEAAAATYIEIIDKFGRPNYPFFHANHPFFFAILSNTTVFFAGHVAKL